MLDALCFKIIVMDPNQLKYHFYNCRVIKNKVYMDSYVSETYIK